ncbi:hypothetical protein [uncultured Roseovarius sp.]|uniref:hypothetical protein n=1 Tax=uncultured Roseovarius sp. TaxID=293344 RepID=UPI00261C2792|nr:hypothetical protein [uncultured Roseovarius sp.]
MRSENFSNGFVWLGVLLAALSSVKALNAFLDFGFKGIWADILTYYTRVTEPFRVLVSKIPFLVDAPDWLPDVLLLYAILVMAGLRSTVLPYRFDDYYRMHNTRRTYDVEYSRDANETFDEFFERQDEFDRERMISCVQNDDRFIVKLRDIIPRWELIFRQTVKCLTLWPIISLEPLRKMDNSIRFVRQMLKKAVSGDGTIEFETEGRRGFYAKWAIDVDKLRLDGFLQIISLPILVTLFLIGATYIN